MKSYIKIYGPPLLKAIKALEKVAIDMPEVCIWNTIIEASPILSLDDIAGIRKYFHLEGDVAEKRCGTIISKSGEKVGEYDFYFEWLKDPSMEELNNLIAKIDTALDPLGCKYTITTK